MADGVGADLGGDGSRVGDGAHLLVSAMIGSGDAAVLRVRIVATVCRIVSGWYLHGIVCATVCMHERL